MELPSNANNTGTQLKEQGKKPPLPIKGKKYGIFGRTSSKASNSQQNDSDDEELEKKNEAEKKRKEDIKKVQNIFAKHNSLTHPK
jgi:hypothetical protein